MLTNPLDSATLPKPPKSRKGKTPGKPSSKAKTAKDTTAQKKPRSRRSPSAAAQISAGEQVPAARPEAATRPARYFLAREGVAFGPFSEFQMRESLRLGIFDPMDLALAEDGEEWLELGRLLPVKAAPAATQPPGEAPARSPGTGDDKNWRYTPVAQPAATAPREPRLHKRPATPLSEHLLREHEIQFGNLYGPSFMTELTRGRLAFAVVPVAVVLFGLLSLSAVLKHREPPASAGTHAGFTRKPLVVGR